VYSLQDPGEFHYRAFAAFCDAITSGEAPFERVDAQSDDGKMFEEMIAALYQTSSA